jgi:hypothetical protein
VNKFAYESVLQRISSLTRLYGLENQLADESVLRRISLLKVCALVNQFPDEVVWYRESVR